MIDHIITNNEEYLTHHGVLTTSLSDHNLIFTIRKIDRHRGPPRYIQTRSLNNFNEAKFIQDIQNTNWPMPKDSDEINHIWEDWKPTLQAVLDGHAPCRVKRVRNATSPWVNQHLKKEMYDRDILKKKATNIFDI